MTDVTNGKAELPPAREAIIEQAQRIHQELSHERDTLAREVWSLKNDVAGYKVALEAHASNEAQRESRMAELQAQRDEAVARRAQVETVVESVNAILRAFLIEHTPLVRPAEKFPHSESGQ